MTIQECLRILQLPDGATPAQVKHAFRRLAFQYHPDLNADPAASAKFREVNEAYVTAKDLLGNGDGPAGTAAADAEGREKPSASRRDGAEAYARQQKRQGKPHFTHQQSARSRHQGMYYKEEEVLKDILNDPFARQVFEDIYSKIRKEQPGYKGPLEVKRRRVKLHWGERTLNLDFRKGLFGSVKAWFKGQMDHEQTVYFPAIQLMPGRKIRISVEQSFSKGPRTVEVTLPRDFVVGRPIRLKGLGRKLGPLAGDLILRVYAR
ncbi:DnaJ domain-containing protein [Pseudodesulfovibrio sp.]|uniref:J domain-containing protein n=1 Tax=Pseudodesulfovibrio sp. TaxID=2035812 RepID=UPI0026073BDA|nr:DnaJ domain-containing protein [Pseudodesulfovibrio sp.]MDD3310680.1 DnaJ domain-containing protein [Pseudodesulfovibrio sp.]